MRKLSTLFAVEVIRRDPLDRSTPIDSPLAKVASLVRKSRGEGTEPIAAATVTPLPVQDKPAPRPAGVVVDDLSDYID
ncbi:MULTISPECIES: hypothetical protein [Amycolatopsis]|uniref:hypothetical protein n=1 Tax=Amycolatopsis TaxID=1813 RepID=UPI001E64422C|nr:MULTISPECIES: hypothetical protein [Amycolatopsis]